VTKPLVSVLMPVYNADKFLNESINSILDQTFTDFEFIIINDGSTDSSLKIIQELRKKDNRITLINRKNKGLITSLNEYVSVAKGKYLVRMDADDISHQNRISEQLKFMEEHPDISILGSYIECFGDNITNSIWKLPSQDEALKARLIFTVPFCHPSVMYKKIIFSEGGFRYQKDFINAEDYELWTSLSEKYKFGVVPKVLLKYRYVPTSVSRISDSSNINERRLVLSSIYNRYLSRLGISNSPEEDKLHFYLTTSGRIKSIELNLIDVAKYLTKILDKNQEKKIFCPNALKGFLARKFLVVFFYQIRKGNFSAFSGILNKLFCRAIIDILRKRAV